MAFCDCCDDSKTTEERWVDNSPSINPASISPSRLMPQQSPSPTNLLWVPTAQTMLPLSPTSPAPSSIPAPPLPPHHHMAPVPPAPQQYSFAQQYSTADYAVPAPSYLRPSAPTEQQLRAPWTLPPPPIPSIPPSPARWLPMPQMPSQPPVAATAAPTATSVSAPLPSFVVPLNSADDPCLICQEPLHTQKVSSADCKHFAHTACMRQWLADPDTQRCPLCRKTPFVAYDPQA